MRQQRLHGSGTRAQRKQKEIAEKNLLDVLQPLLNVPLRVDVAIDLRRLSHNELSIVHLPTARARRCRRRPYRLRTTSGSRPTAHRRGAARCYTAHGRRCACERHRRRTELAGSACSCCSAGSLRRVGNGGRGVGYLDVAVVDGRACTGRGEDGCRRTTVRGDGDERTAGGGLAGRRTEGLRGVRSWWVGGGMVVARKQKVHFASPFDLQYHHSLHFSFY